MICKCDVIVYCVYIKAELGLNSLKPLYHKSIYPCKCVYNYISNMNV